jgi:nitrite reductase (NADH) small subunit
MNWIRVTNAENIPRREGRAVRVGGQEIAIFNLGDRFTACDNACPHRGGPLADGIVSGTAVVCPLHAYRLCLDTGKVTKPDLCVKVETYPVRVEEGVVMVALPDAQEKAA